EIDRNLAVVHEARQKLLCRGRERGHVNLGILPRRTVVTRDIGNVRERLRRGAVANRDSQTLRTYASHMSALEPEGKNSHLSVAPPPRRRRLLHVNETHTCDHH